MLKRNVCIYIILTSLLFVFSIVVRFSVKDRAIYGVRKLEDLETIQFTFPGVLREEKLPTNKMLLEDLDSSEYILKVKPTGKLKFSGYVTMQEVQVEQCINNSGFGEKSIWIINENGFYYNKAYDTVYNFGWDNLMSEQYSYIVVLDTVVFQDTVYYYNDFRIGALRYSDEEIYKYIDTTQQYNYVQLKEYEFLAADEATMHKLYAGKAEVFSYLQVKYGFVPI